MKKWFIVTLFLGVLILFMAGCGKSVDFKDPDDRKTVTTKEMSTIVKTVKKMDGVADFTIDYDETGLYAELSVKDKKQAQPLAEKAFNLMWAETSKSVDLFVKPAGNNNEILIQAFKPVGSDEDNKWDILY